MKARYHQVKLQWRHVLIHVLCWAVFMGYELGVLRYSYGKLEPWSVYLLFYALNIAYFYTYVRILNLTFDRSRPQYVKGPLWWLLLILVYLLVKRLADHWVYRSDGAYNPLEVMKTVTPAYVFRTVYFTILATFYWASGYIAYYRKQQLILARDKAEISNAYLQQQISPHMLFNTLNFIYSTVYERSAEAARSVLLLSDLIRFGLESTGPDGKTALAEELKQVRQLIEMNRFRFHHRLGLELEASGDFSPFRVIPMVLLTLTENVFKHGNLKEPERPARIEVSVTPAGTLSYTSSNLKKSAGGPRQSKQLGLANIRLRLDFAYPGAYRIAISETETSYTLHLTITL